jgi:hypothetical protein
MNLLTRSWSVERTWGRAIRFVLKDQADLKRG